MIIISVLRTVICYHRLYHVRFKVLSAVMNVTVFWDKMPFSLVLPSSTLQIQQHIF